jgi:hypothetical protein
MLGDSLKIWYNPSEEYRYELSGDEYSRERFRALVEIYKELQKLIPQIPISFSFFGSLTKGKPLLDKNTAENTDIDIDIKFDGEILGRLTQEEWQKLGKSLGFNYIDQTNFAGYLKDFLLNKLDSKRDNLGFTKIPEKDISITEVDENSIKDKLRSVTYFWFQNEDRPERIPLNCIELASYFTLSIGKTVEKYRNKFLKEQILEMEDIGNSEIIWMIIKDCVEEVERRGQIPEKTRKQFPQTLEEALKFYEVSVGEKK